MHLQNTYPLYTCNTCNVYTYIYTLYIHIYTCITVIGFIDEVLFKLSCPSILHNKKVLQSSLNKVVLICEKTLFCFASNINRYFMMVINSVACLAHSSLNNI